jgi:hypothetical protein
MTDMNRILFIRRSGLSLVAAALLTAPLARAPTRP